MNDHEGHAPFPFADGTVPQTIVHYDGLKRGAMTYRGRASGRRYPFDAGDCCKYIPDDDLELFRVHSEFTVFDGDDSHIDPAAVRAQAERQQLTAEVARELLSKLSPYLPGPDKPPKKASAGRGRPRIPDDQLRLLLHLRDHVTKPWFIRHLATEFAGDAIDPEATIKKRLERARKRRGSLGDNCEYCDVDFDPARPHLESN